MTQVRDDVLRQTVLRTTALRTSHSAYVATESLEAAAQTTLVAALPACRNGVASITDLTDLTYVE
jgi:hypothetical protein